MPEQNGLSRLRDRPDELEIYQEVLDALDPPAGEPDAGAEAGRPGP